MNFSFFMPYMPIIWLAMGIGFCIWEAVTVQLVAVWFAIGSAVTIVPAMMGLSFTVQMIVFFTFSLGTMIVTRPIVKQKLTFKQTATNADGNIGKIATVIIEINNSIDQGRVHLEGLDWSARSEDGEIIEVGEKVLVKSMIGVKVFVEHIL